MGFSHPAPLKAESELKGFRSGVESMDGWVERHAYRNHVRRFSQVFITKDDEGMLAGLYTLSSCTVERSESGRRWSSGPREIPVILIGKLAVDERFQGHGLGASLLQDAVRRGIEVSRSIAAAAILVHTKNEAVVPFYEKFGFERLGTDRNSLVLPLARLDEQLGI